MADENQHSLRRSSSQASDVSSHSGKVRTVRVRPKKSLSSNSSLVAHQDDPSLTSFPSLSPQSAFSPPDPTSAPSETPARTVSQRTRDRKATLASLTNASPSLQGRVSLFDDSPRSSLDIPGALHLATDDHIERLLARNGAVKLIRQFAQDLAHRDAEISLLRIRADERERELKKMLREVEVSSLDIERRLHQLENGATAPDSDTEEQPEANSRPKKKITNSIDDMMHQAMQEEVGPSNDQQYSGIGIMNLEGATMRQSKNDRDETSSITSALKRAGSIKSWQGYLWGSANTSRKTSRSSSIVSTDVTEDRDATAKARAPLPNAGRRKGLENLFAPPPAASSSNTTSYFIGGVKKPVSKPLQADTASINSKKSERSITSWTVKLFAGNPQKDNDETTGRGRASSLGQASKSTTGRPAGSSSALASLAKVSNSPTPPLVRSSTATKLSQQPLRKAYPSTTTLSSSPDAINQGGHSNLGPVEMDAILPDDTKPPTMMNTYTYNHYSTGNLLTDRFGFIYDQRQRKRQREAAMSIKQAKRKSGMDSLGGLLLNSEVDGNDSPKSQERKVSNRFSWQRPPTPTSQDEQPTEPAPAKGWQDYLRIATRPTELLSHTPSAGVIVNLTVAESTTTPPVDRSRTSSFAVDALKGSLPVPTQNPEPTTSTVVATSPEFINSTIPPEISRAASPANDQEPVKLLLEQLTELHDKLQAEKAVKWNEFLRKVRAERGAAAAAAAASDRQANKGKKTANMPEASLLDGEVVGVTNLGNKGRIGRAKWKEFKVLVLGGIPVSLRPKIWSECSGASDLRIPGYYEDLVAASTGPEQSDDDAEVAAQIQADIYRTLTDNVFFRHGPGTTKLREVLLAYARRNPAVGYCQGMNMIAGSLLLIMPTTEDVFWILVAMIENILPAHYYDHGLVTSRADQIVLRQYVTEVLPRLSGHLEELSVELEAMTFQWFLSVFTDCLSAEALYRVWDVVLCLNSTSSASPTSPTAATIDAQGNKTDSMNDDIANAGTGSTFLFQLALALLKLNEPQLLACDNAASVYGYINHNMTNHAISIDGLIQASEGLRKVVRREDVLEKRAKAIQEMVI